ncbi:MAG TPA: bifunctional adenosylcobinamide kinase/adenosylcobinamide-phosphate guanylyltransferase [Acidimicrobiia bacterium]
MIVVVIGGTRSGKSEIAEQVASKLGEPVTVVVPAMAVDDEHSERIAQHRERRPPSWATVECGPDLLGALDTIRGTVLVDSLGTWVSASPSLDVDVGALLDVLHRRVDASVLVTEEVGLSVHPSTEVGRRFVDALGALNAAVAEIADEVLLVVAGRTLRLDP